LKGERKVSLFSFLKVVDFYVFWQYVWNKTSKKCQTMNCSKCTIFFALIKLTINVQLFIDRWNVSKSLKLSLKWNFQYKLIVFIINKQCSWMKFIAHVVGHIHEIRLFMKYIYGSNWPHKCNCSTCESKYIDQLWWHHPNWIFKMTLITRVKIRHMNEIGDTWIYNHESDNYMNSHMDEKWMSCMKIIMWKKIDNMENV
jgi:hypothetical protein